jgi:hypothetical protein
LFQGLDRGQDDSDGSDDPDYSQRDAISARGRKMTRSGRVVARPGRLSPELVTTKRSPVKAPGNKSYPRYYKYIIACLLRIGDKLIRNKKKNTKCSGFIMFTVHCINRVAFLMLGC